MVFYYPLPNAEGDLAARWSQFLREHPGAKLHPPEVPGDPWELDLTASNIIRHPDPSLLLHLARSHAVSDGA